MAVADDLIQRGHNLTIVTTVPLNDRNPKYNHVLIPASESYKQRLKEGLEAVSKSDISVFQGFKREIDNFATWTTNNYEALRADKFQDLLNGSAKFDLMILGYFFNDFQLAAAIQLKIPVVLSWLMQPLAMINTYTGNPTGIGFVPNLLVTISPQMNFFERLASTLMDYLTYAIESFSNYKFEQYYEYLLFYNF